MVVKPEFIDENYPIHKLVWENRTGDLESLLSRSDFNKDEFIEKLDPRGRTPLLLAVVLGHREIALILLKNNADAQFEHSSGWNVAHEAICRGDKELIKIILEYRDAQKRSKRSRMVPDILRRLADTPDFFIEMKFELSTWMPFLGKVIPGNVHRVYKMGSKVRVDSVLLEEGPTKEGPYDWMQGMTLIFEGLDDSVRVVEVYHHLQQTYSSVILSGSQSLISVPDSYAYEKTAAERLSHPVMTAYVDFNKIAFERSKTAWGWGIDKTEKVNNRECKVFGATNVQFVTKMRTEHLSEAEKTQASNKGVNQLQRIMELFGDVEITDNTQAAGTSTHGASSSGSGQGNMISPAQYFDAEHDLQGRDIGHPKEMRTKINKFKAHVWLCEDYPVNLQEQVMPVVDLMALSSSMFGRLKQFIQMQIPAGFPVKTEIPFFHVVTGRVQFYNILGTESDVPGVNHIQEDNGRVSCVLDEELFVPPPHYRPRSTSQPTPLNASDDDLFSWTLPDDDQELPTRDHGKMVDIYEALNAPRTLMKDITPDSDTEEQLLQRAIEESLMLARMQENPGWRPSTENVGSIGSAARLSHPDQEQGAFARTKSFEELEAALDMSRRQVEEDERLRQEEEEAIKKVLELSLKEK